MKNVEIKKKSFIVLNYGCSANRAITEGLIGILKRSGYPIAQSIEGAELIIINTCIVKQNTEHRMKSQLLSLSNNKELIVTGCLPVVMRDWVTQNLPNAKILFPENANQIVELINKQVVQEKKIVSPSIWSQIYANGRFSYNPVITAIEISRGCVSNCSYCIVKKVKGTIRSRSPESIVLEIKKAVKNGTKEIWLTSQDLGSYGWDFTPKKYLPSLIEFITEIKGNFFVRLGMMTPNTLKNFRSDLILQLKKKKVFNFLHLPIQSGSDAILKAMKRKEEINYFIKLINLLRQEIEELVFATDIIVGFPGETQTDFLKTKELIQQLKPTIVNISRYTDRPGTLAADMPYKISTKIKTSRSNELGRLTNEITHLNMKNWIGWKGIVLIDETGKKTNQYVGRNTSYLPVIIEDRKLELGQFVNVQIVESGLTYLIGEII